MNVMALLEYLDDELSRGTSVPLTGKRMVDTEKCLDIISELRVNLPEDVKDAELIMRDKDRILKDAQHRAEDIVSEAEKRFAYMVSEHSILREAEDRAQELLNSAKKDAKDIRSSAILYAEDLFADLEKRILDNLADVRKNRQDLHTMR